MMIEEALVSRLAADVAVLAALGGTARIYPQVRLQNSPTPALVYTKISSPRDHNQQGSDGFTSPRFQFDCWAATESLAKTLADKVRLCLEGFAGTISGVEINGCFVEDERDAYDDEEELRGVQLDVMVMHNEAKPA